jgi:hypothetical protein
MAFPGCGPVAVSLVTGMPVGLVNEALLDCGHDGAATKPSNLAGRAEGLSIISEPNQQIEPAKSAQGLPCHIGVASRLTIF